jgi:hypothetical protein
MNAAHPHFLARLAVMAVSLLGVAAAQDNKINITIRTAVETPAGKSLGPHPKFVMFPAVEVASGLKLVRPVPPATLTAVLQLLQEKLQAQGYLAVGERDHPDVLLTVQYGRGFLANPYSRGVPGPGAIVFVSGLPDLDNNMDREAKRQAAQEEKLFFTITAWDFASMQKGAKRVQFWTTTMFVDDPDNYDLGTIYQQMIAAGAEYFNRRTDREEVEIATRVREGRVEIGAPRVVEEPKPKR